MPGQVAPFYPRPSVRPSAPAQQASVDPAIVAASVQVSIPGAGGSGTCILVADRKTGDGKLGLVLTCKHVVPAHSKGIVVTFPSGQKYAAVWVASDDAADLTCVAINADETTPYIPLAQTHPVGGDDICQVGYPAGRGLTRRSGKVLGYAPWSSGLRRFLVSFEIASGDSGSGVFLTREKALCGVLWGIVDNREYSAVEWKVCKAFVETRCLPWCKPRAPGVQPPGPPGIIPGILGLPDLKKAMADLNARLDDFDVRMKRMDGAVDKFKDVPEGMKKLEAAAALLAQMAATGGMAGPAGKAGAPGAPGPAGKDGAQGPPGKDADNAAMQTQLETLRSEVAALRGVVQNLNGSIRVKIEPVPPK